MHDEIIARAAQPPIEGAEYRTVLGHFASGVVVVTGLDDGEPVGFTCQSFFSVSLDPPLVAVAASRSSTSWPRVARTGAFCANVLGAEQEALARTFAVSGGDKFQGVGWSATATGAPRMHDVLAWVDCVIEDIHEAGDHYLVVGRVLDMATGPGQPLLFYRAGFGTFAS